MWESVASVRLYNQSLKIVADVHIVARRVEMMATELLTLINLLVLLLGGRLRLSIKVLLNLPLVHYGQDWALPPRVLNSIKILRFAVFRKLRFIESMIKTVKTFYFKKLKISTSGLMKRASTKQFQVSIGQIGDRSHVQNSIPKSNLFVERWQLFPQQMF